MKKRLKGPVIRLRDQTPVKANDNGPEPPKRSVIVDPKSKRASVFGNALDPTEEELKQARDKADARCRELVRRAAAPATED